MDISQYWLDCVTFACHHWFQAHRQELLGASYYSFSGGVLLRTQSCFFQVSSILGNQGTIFTNLLYAISTLLNTYFGYVLFNIMTWMKFTLFFVSPLATHFPQFLWQCFYFYLFKRASLYLHLSHYHFAKVQLTDKWHVWYIFSHDILITLPTRTFSASCHCFVVQLVWYRSLALLYNAISTCIRFLCCPWTCQGFCVWLHYVADSLQTALTQ